MSVIQNLMQDCEELSARLGVVEKRLEVAENRLSLGGQGDAPVTPFLQEIQDRHAKWTKHNFPDQTPSQALIGAMEELGELAHAHLKGEQGIRLQEDHDAAAKDAVGDIVLFLMAYCTHRGWSLYRLLLQVTDRVWGRDWATYPIGGKPPEGAA